MTGNSAAGKGGGAECQCNQNIGSEGKRHHLKEYWLQPWECLWGSMFH